MERDKKLQEKAITHTGMHLGIPFHLVRKVIKSQFDYLQRKIVSDEPGECRILYLGKFEVSAEKLKKYREYMDEHYGTDHIRRKRTNR